MIKIQLAKPNVTEYLGEIWSNSQVLIILKDFYSFKIFH